jgi:hypothetical protein
VRALEAAKNPQPKLNFLKVMIFNDTPARSTKGERKIIASQRQRRRVINDFSSVSVTRRLRHQMCSEHLEEKNLLSAHYVCLKMTSPNGCVRGRERADKRGGINCFSNILNV